MRGGNEVFANLFKSLKGKHEFVVITDRVKGQHPDWRTEAIHSRAVSYYYSLSSYFFAKDAIAKFAEIASREKFDLILVNQVTAKSILALKEFGIPVALIIHHPVSADIDLAISESASFLEQLTWRFKYGNSRQAQKKLVHSLDHIITVSEASREKIAADYSVDPAKIHVIHNGIDTDFYKKTKPTQPKTVLTVGSYQHPRRGFPYLLQVYKKLSELGYTINDAGRRTEEQAAILDRIPHVTQHEVVVSENMPDLYSEASVFISTSLYEGFGLSIAEAFSCETPVVAFGVGGAVDVMARIFPEGICSPRNVPVMVEKIREICEGQGSVRPGSELRAAVIENFSIEAMARAYDKYFTTLIAKS